MRAWRQPMALQDAGHRNPSTLSGQVRTTTADHTVDPQVSWDNFQHYMDLKRALLAGEL